MKKIAWMLLCFCLLIPSLASCAAPKEKLGYLLVDGVETHPGAVLTLEGKDVSFEEFRYFYLKLRDDILAEDKDAFQNEEKEKELKEEALQLILNKRALETIIEDEKIELTGEEKERLDEEAEHAIEIYGGSESFLSLIHDSYMSLASYRDMLSFTALREKLMAKYYGENGSRAWDDETFYAYYRENYLAVQVIRIAYLPGEGAEDHPETLEKIEAIKQRVDAGEDFWALVEEVGEDDNMEAYPDGYYVTKGEAEEILYEAAKALATGEVSDPVAAKDGLYLLKRVELKQNRMDQNRAAALNGYTDAAGAYHAGAYDDEFEALILARANDLKVEFSDVWDKISTKTVF